MDSRTGRPAGPLARRPGAARSMARVARARATAAPLCLAPPRLLTTATQVSRIGCKDGLCRRRHGAVRTQARVALSRAAALEQQECAQGAAGALALSVIFRRLQAAAAVH